MNTKLKLFLVKGLSGIFLAAFLIIGFKTGARAETLSGRVNVTYDYTTGELQASYIGTDELSKKAVYTWFKNGTEVSTGTSDVYSPDVGGKYTAELTDVNFEGAVTSNTVMLYEVNTNSDLYFNSPNALYRAGNTVRATMSLSSDQEIDEWTIDISGLNITTRANYATFTMPAADLNINCTYSTTYLVKVFGGKADVSRAASGEVFTIRASSIDGKTFLGWKTSGGGTFDSNTSSVTQFKMPSNDVSIVATFVENSVLDRLKSSSSRSSSRSSSMRGSSLYGSSAYGGYGSGSSSGTSLLGGLFGNGNVRISDPVHTVYEVLWSNNYRVDMFHHAQGPLCDLQFKNALNGDKLVLDYYNIVINNNYNIRETPTPVTIRLTIPMDLQWPGRKWRMMCVGRSGQVFSFPDEDVEDETITFSPDRFYAFAMAYNDEPDVVEVEEEEEVEEVEGYVEFSDDEVKKITEEPSEEKKEQVSGGMSQAHSSNEMTVNPQNTPPASSEQHSSAPPQGGNNTNAAVLSTPTNISSDKSSAITNSKGSRLSEINL